MYQICEFNPECDLGRTIEGMAVDMSAAIETGVIEDTGIDIEFNDISDVEHVGSRISDQFDAVDKQAKALNKAAAAFQMDKVVNPAKGEGD